MFEQEIRKTKNTFYRVSFSFNPKKLKLRSPDDRTLYSIMSHSLSHYHNDNLTHYLSLELENEVDYQEFKSVI